MRKSPVAAWPNRMLSIRDVTSILGVSRATIYDWLGKETFPAPIRLGPNRVAWSSIRVDEWLASRPEVRHAA